MFIWLIAWVFCIFFQSRIIKCSDNQSPYQCLAYKRILPIRGILAIEIFFGHFYGGLQHSQILWVSSKIGVLVVGLFLFLSGWGLWESKNKKENYLQGFLWKHIKTLGIPLYCCYLIDFFILKMPQGEYTISEMIRAIFGSHLKDFTNWFIWELIILYLLFYILYKCFSVKTGNVLLLVVLVSFVVISSTYGIASRWYGSILCFALGVLFSQNKDKIFSFFKKKYIFTLLTSTGLLMITIMMFIKYESNLYINAVSICLSAILFCIAAILILIRIQIGNKITTYLGEISYEIFIIHFTMIYFFKSVIHIEPDFLYVTATVSTTILTATVVKAIARKTGVKIEKAKE